MSSVVFLGGPPCSGKSTLAREIAATLDHVQTATAGQLIRDRLGSSDQYVRPPVADRDRAAFFQELLIEEFDRIRATHDGIWLLDGHYVVPTDGGLVEVPADVFRRLRCTHLALLNVDPATIEQRLVSRGGAAWWDESTEAVEQLARRELEHAAEVGLALAMPVDRWSTISDALAAASSWAVQ